MLLQQDLRKEEVESYWSKASVEREWTHDSHEFRICLVNGPQDSVTFEIKMASSLLSWLQGLY